LGIKIEPDEVALATINWCAMVCHFCEKTGHLKTTCHKKQKYKDWKQSTMADIVHSVSTQDLQWGDTDFAF
jgi:hypothetical protein